MRARHMGSAVVALLLSWEAIEAASSYFDFGVD